LENGNLINCINYYKKEMINEVNIIEKSYNKSNHWIINDEIRNKYFDNLIGLINEIKLQQKELSNINNSHDINDTTFINLRKDLYNIQLPSFDEKIIDVFSQINKIEHLIDRYIFYVYRQVIKSNFNKNIMDIFEKIQKDLLKILNDGNKKIEEIKNLSNYSLKELKLYNEGEKVIEKNLKENKSSFPQIRLKTEQDKDYSNTFSKIKLTKHSYLRDLIIKEKLNLEKNINLRKRVKSEINENNNLCFTHGNNEIKMIPNKKSSRSTLVDINKIDRIFSMPVRNKKKK
jgi:hypothetical protein